jgi:nickel/cobalt transporter (NiCoT) family protein
VADGKKPKAAGFWFAMSHSMMVLILAVPVIAGTHAASILLDDNSAARSVLKLAGTLASAGFSIRLASSTLLRWLRSGGCS